MEHSDERTRMSKTRMIGIVGLIGVVAVGAGTVLATGSTGRQADSPPPLPPPPVGHGIELVYAQPYLLDEGYTHWWRAEQPTVSAGYLLVLAVDSDLVFPRQGYQPVLYVGGQTAERINVGFVPDELAPGSKANVIALVPAEHDRRGEVTLDLATTPIWFGTPELPERVDEERLLQEYVLARERGIVPPPSAVVEAARRRGGGPLYARDYVELQHHAAELIRRYSPGEADLIEGLLAPPPERARVIR